MVCGSVAEHRTEPDLVLMHWALRTLRSRPSSVDFQPRPLSSEVSTSSWNLLMTLWTVSFQLVQLFLNGLTGEPMSIFTSENSSLSKMQFLLFLIHTTFSTWLQDLFIFQRPPTHSRGLCTSCPGTLKSRTDCMKKCPHWYQQTGSPPLQRSPKCHIYELSSRKFSGMKVWRNYGVLWEERRKDNMFTVSKINILML